MQIVAIFNIIHILKILIANEKIEHKYLKSR